MWARFAGKESHQQEQYFWKNTCTVKDRKWCTWCKKVSTWWSAHNRGKPSGYQQPLNQCCHGQNFASMAECFPIEIGSSPQSCLVLRGDDEKFLLKLAKYNVSRETVQVLNNLVYVMYHRLYYYAYHYIILCVCCLLCLKVKGMAQIFSEVITILLYKYWFMKIGRASCRERV